MQLGKQGDVSLSSNILEVSGALWNEHKRILAFLKLIGVELLIPNVRSYSKSLKITGLKPARHGSQATLRLPLQGIWR